MGTKGRDIFLYLFFLNAFAVVAGKLLGLPATPFFITFFAAGIAALLYIPYLAWARKWSKKLGLKHIILLPVSHWQADLLIFLAGEKIRRGAKHAFEVHIEVAPNLSLTQFLKLLGEDLVVLKKKMPGSLFIWETSAPIPAFVRTLIKEKKKKSEAFWKKGQWAVPHFPFTARDIKKNKVRIGAFLLRKEDDKSTTPD